MRYVCLFAVLLPGLAQAGFISFESSQTFASASVSGCQVVRWGADNGAVSDYTCGASSDAGTERADAAAPHINGPDGPYDAFGIGVWHEDTVITDEEFDVTARYYYGGNWFEGNFQGTFGWTGVFTLADDAVLSMYGFSDRSASQGSTSLLVRSISSGELVYGGVDQTAEMRLAGGTKYAVTWLTSESAYGLVTGGSASVGVAPLADFNITRVPEPGTLALFGAALLGLFLVRRRKQN